MEFSEVVKNRYSCKKFSARKLDGAKLEEILQAGCLAPTAKNLQEQHIYVVQSEEGLAKIDSGHALPDTGAPTCLVVTYDRGNVFTYPGEKRVRRGGCEHRGNPPAAGRRQCRRGQLLDQLH